MHRLHFAAWPCRTSSALKADPCPPCSQWFYGKEIFEARGVPIGLVATSDGGTPAEAWSSPDAMAECYNPPPMPPGPVLPPQVKIGPYHIVHLPLAALH